MGTSAAGGRPARGIALVLVLGLLLAATLGCSVRTGAADSRSAWRERADTTLGTAESSLGTAKVLLENQERGRLTRAFVVVALRDAIEVLDKEAATFLLAQPPRSLAALNERAVGTLGDALDAVAAAATAASAPDRSERARALAGVRGTTEQVRSLLDEIESRVP